MRLAAAANAITSSPEKLVEHVVFVRGEHQPRDRQPHLLRDPTRQDVAEIAGGYRERHSLLARPCRRQIAYEVVDDLRYHPAPIHRINAADLEALHELQIAGNAIDDVLTIVEYVFP